MKLFPKGVIEGEFFDVLAQLMAGEGVGERQEAVYGRRGWRGSARRTLTPAFAAI